MRAFHRGRLVLGKLAIGAAAVVSFVTLTPVQALANPVSCGDVITRNTTLTNDLTNCDGDGLVIGASNITLNLNGHSIDGTGNGSGVNNGAGFDFVTIKSGNIQEFQENVTLNNIARRNHLVNLTLSNGTTFGIAVYQSDHNWIERNTASGNGLGIDGDGIHLDVGSNYNLVDRNSVHDNATVGIAVYGGSENNTVVGNVVTGNPNRGISVTNANNNAVVNNVVGDAGIFLNQSNGSRVEGNFSYGDGAGIGLEQSANNVIRRNITTRNTEGIGIHNVSANNLVKGNRASGNDQNGITVDPGSLGNVIQQNTANNNNGDGIHVDEPLTTLTGNTANNNGGWGIYAPGASDGGGNTASGNGAGQCLGVSCS